MSVNKKTDSLYFFDRPTVPIFVPRDDDGTRFNIPTNYLADRYQTVDVTSRFSTTKDPIPVKEIVLPPVGIAGDMRKNENLSLFLPRHRKMASHLIKILIGMRSYDDFISACVYYHDRVNPQLYIYCISVAILHRTDTENLPLPPLCETFPDKFVPRSVLSQAKEDTNLLAPDQRMPIVIPRDYTASNLEPENRVAYFREDVGINLHHWHWHLVYPIEGPLEIVNKDRRGELLYYMHSQIMSRYNFERFCNSLPRVERWNKWREPIEEAYFPKLDTLVSSRTWPARPANSVLSDINRPTDQLQFDIQDLERWRDRITNVITSGNYEDANGAMVQLPEKEGINILGNIMESNMLSPNPRVYGDLHNLMHVGLSFVHDPDHKYLETFSPIGDPAVTMRDPLFYRLHAWVEYAFQLYKQTLNPYSVGELNYPGISVTGVELISNGQPKNVFHTFWQQSDVNLSRGLDFVPRGPVLARFTHLQHDPFSYKIQVNNTTGSNKMGTCRIYLAPKTGETGRQMQFSDQKNFMIELDKFTVNLRPGNNTVERASVDSSVTIPFERTFRDVDSTRPTDPSQLDAFNFCGCGWPQHMLIPKGTESGFEAELFVMISNYDNDKVEQDTSGQCTDAASYCGIRNRKYPDARAMGYPFDRTGRTGVNVLAQFLTANMKTLPVRIRHTNSIIARRTTNDV